MIRMDALIFDGLRSVLGRLAGTVDFDETTRLRRKLLETQIRLELGQIDLYEFGQIEAALLERLRQIRRRARAAA